MSESPNSLAQYFRSGAIWAFGGKIAAAVLSLAFYAMLARMLRPSELGIYVLSLSIVTIAAVFARGGIEFTVLRHVSAFLAKDDQAGAKWMVKRGYLLASAHMVVTSGIIALLTPSLFARTFSQPVLADLGPAMGWWVTLHAAQMLFSETLRGFRDIRGTTLYGGFISTALTTAFAAALWMLGTPDLETVITLTLCAFTLSNVAAAGSLYRRLRATPRAPAPRASSRDILATSWPLMFNSLTFIALTQADVWILSAARAPDQVAVYGAAARLVLIISLPLTIANALLPPIISAYSASNRHTELEKIARRTSTVVTIPAVTTWAVFIVFGADVIRITYGDSYQAGYSILGVLGFAQVVNVVSGSCGAALMMTGHQRALLGISAACGLLGVGLAAATVGPYGGPGVALSMAGAYSAQQIGMVLYVRKRCGFWTHASVRMIPSLLRHARIWAHRT